LATTDHAALLARIEPEQSSEIKADSRTGYAVGLDRR
jgi:hypothetical protein